MKLLILDLDETLIYCPDEDAGFFHRRPHLDDFLKYAFENFAVAVWTAGGKGYKEWVLSELGIREDSLFFAWDRSRCTTKRCFTTYQEVHYKKMQKVFRLGKFGKGDILFVDNTPSAIDSYGNVIPISTWEGDEKDEALKKLPLFLDSLKDVEDEKRGWFSQVAAESW